MTIVATQLSRPGASASDDKLPLLLTGLVETAEFIGHVRITEKAEAQFEYEGRTLACGFIYRGEVVEKLKGGDGPVSFFSKREVAITPRGEFSVLLTRADESVRAFEEDVAGSMYKGEDLARELCAIRSLDLRARSDSQSLVAFDPILEKESGELWLERTPESLTAMKEFPYREYSFDGQKRSAVRWIDCKRVINALSSPGSVD